MLAIADPSHFFACFFCSVVQQRFFETIAPSLGFNVQTFSAEKPARGLHYAKPNVLNSQEVGVILYLRKMENFDRVFLENKPHNSFAKNRYGGKTNWRKHKTFKYMKNPNIFGLFLARYGSDRYFKIVELFAGSAATFLFAREYGFKMEFVEKDKEQTDLWKEKLTGAKQFEIDVTDEAIPKALLKLLGKGVETLEGFITDDDESEEGEENQENQENQDEQADDEFEDEEDEDNPPPNAGGVRIENTFVSDYSEPDESYQQPEQVSIRT